MPGNWNWTNSLILPQYLLECHRCLDFSVHKSSTWLLFMCPRILPTVGGHKKYVKLLVKVGIWRFLLAKASFLIPLVLFLFALLTWVEIQMFWGFESISCEWPTDGGFAFSARAADHRWAEESQKMVSIFLGSRVHCNQSHPQDFRHLTLKLCGTFKMSVSPKNIKMPLSHTQRALELYTCKSYNAPSSGSMIASA